MTKRKTFQAFVKANNRQVKLSAWENQQLDSDKQVVFIAVGDNQYIKIFSSGKYELENIPENITLNPFNS